ncbi:MAG: TlpA disulfide reductase family protein [bacterium]|nr:TlpA disulfide reductase family protein [bacterium]
MSSPTQQPQTPQPTGSDLATQPPTKPPRVRTVRWVVLTIGVLAVALVVVFAVSEREQRVSPLPDFAPEFAGTTLDGSGFDMNAQRGRWVVVNFFSTWCAECVVEHLELVAFHQRYRNNPNIRLVSVVFQDDTEAIARFFAERGGDWPVVVSNTSGAAIGFGVTAVPETYLVDPGGGVVARFVGGVTLAAMQEQLALAGAV